MCGTVPAKPEPYSVCDVAGPSAGPGSRALGTALSGGGRPAPVPGPLSACLVRGWPTSWPLFPFSSGPGYSLPLVGSTQAWASEELVTLFASQRPREGKGASEGEHHFPFTGSAAMCKKTTEALALGSADDGSSQALATSQAWARTGPSVGLLYFGGGQQAGLVFILAQSSSASKLADDDCAPKSW